MILYFLLAFSLGIEGGYDIPAVGFNDINTGTSFSLTASRHVKFVDMALALQASFYIGDNPGYSMNAVGFRVDFYKKNWPVSPVLAVGGDYVIRNLYEASENGFAATYAIGFMLNFSVERLHFYPKISYEGFTDLKEHAGFIGLRIGIQYEI
ncbi:MAG: hypothetical protein JSV53_07205 [candidate division WOR-3 bacterium]|nr:MAG: hypothetical protein JSV53_07205 [candidate division WOR-3 bacterium]